MGVMSKSVSHVQEMGQEKGDHNDMDLKGWAFLHKNGHVLTWKKK